MAKIVIDIDDKTYDAFTELIAINLGRSLIYKGIIGGCLNAIKNGKVLPKGHGVLVDSKELRESIDKCRPFTKYYQDNYPMLNQAKSDLLMCLDSLTKVIEADKEGQRWR